MRAEAEAETARQTTRFMVDLFKVSDPSEALGNTITAREILDKGAKRIDKELADQPAIQATLMDTMGTVYTSLGLYESADAAGAQGVRAAAAAVGHAASPRLRRASITSGEVLTLRSDYDEAEKRLREALRCAQAAVRPRGAEVAETLMALAEVLGAEGRVRAGRAADPRGAGDPAEGLRQRKPHPDIASSIEALGLNYYRARRVRQGREALARGGGRCRRSCIPTRRIRRSRRRWTTSRSR